MSSHLTETLDTVRPDQWREMSEEEHVEFLRYWRLQGQISFCCLGCGFPTPRGQAACDACYPRPY